MKRLITFILLILGTASWVSAQRTVSGMVTDNDGEPLIGANILATGTLVGTITDIDGSWSLVVPAESNSLKISYIGFTSQEIDLSTVTDFGNISIVLSEGTVLDEVVVTALGTSRNSRNVVYANQSVGGEDLLTTPNKNALEALRGKAAGVKITTGSGSVGASSKVVLRAEASLTGNNNALIVIDGIPIENNSTGGGQGGGESGYADYGNRFNDLNPEDIENITILKGPSATSLYGSRGASGVLLITTKSGDAGKAKINFSSTTSFEQAYVLLQRQDQYGQGLINPDGSKTFDTGENFSWGPALDGVVRPWTSPVDVDGDGKLEYLSRPYSAVPNQLDNFFRTGRTNVNSLSVSGGSQGFTYYASYANTYQRGILENTDYKRNNLTLNATAKLTDRLTSSFRVSYANVDQNTAQEGSRAFEGQNAYANAIQAPNTIPYNELRDYNSPYHDFNGYYGSYTVNPYFVLNEYGNTGKINNVLGNFSLNYNILEGLDLNTKIGANLVNTRIEELTPQYAYADHSAWESNLFLSHRNGRETSAGAYARTNNNAVNLDWTTTASYSRDLDAEGRYSLNVVGGVNLFDRKVRNNVSQTEGGLTVPGVYNLANSVNQASSSQNDSDYRLIGFLGNASIGMDNRLFLEYSARQDYSSTLPLDNQSFFYQAVGVSAVISEYMNLDDSQLSFLKLRGSFGTTGKDAGLYLLESTFLGNPTAITYGDIYSITYPLNGQPGFSKGAQIGNPDLRPELTTTIEFGLDAGFFNDKLNLEYTFYNSNHDDQIVLVSTSRASGFSRTARNVGKITNTGHEIGLTFRPYTNRNGFHWDFNLTFATNKNEVVKISDETDELVIYDSGRGVTLVAETGQPFGTFKSQIPRLDPSGNPIVAGGQQVYTTESFEIGNVQPDWIGGFATTVGWKNLNLNLLLDTRQGGNIYSLTKAATEFNGTALTTLIGDRQPFVIENSVVEIDNGDGTFSYEPNTIPTLADAYVFDGNYGRNVLNGSFIKLREIGLSYDLPSSIYKKLKLSNASIGLFAKNLKFWLPEDNTFGDPEVNGPGTTQQNITGVETSQTPPSRSYGVTLNIQF